MKKLLIIPFLCLLIWCFGTKEHSVKYYKHKRTFTDTFPGKQNIGVANALNSVPPTSGFKANLINGIFADTTAANLSQLKDYAGAQIFTTSGNSIWLRNSTHTAWLQQGAGGSSSSTIIITSDSTFQICNFNGCTTYIVQQPRPFQVIHILNPTTLLICDTLGMSPVCDTFHIPPTNFPDTTILTLFYPMFGHCDTCIEIHKGTDSTNGYIDSSDHREFNNKVDLVTHTASDGLDIIQQVVNGVTKNVDTLEITCNGLGLNAPQVVWDSLLVFSVTSGNYRLPCTLRTNAATTFTLPAADPSFGYFATFGVDTSNNAFVIVGTPAADPVIPAVDPSFQIALTSVLVPATATTFPIGDTTMIYNENIVPPQWTVTNVGTTTNPNNAAAGTIFIGAKSLNVTNINRNDQVNMTISSGSVDLSNYQSVVVNIKFKQAIPATANLALTWLNGTTSVSSNVALQFNRTNTTTYQTLSIPLKNFGISNNVVTQLRLIYLATNNTTNAGFYLDYIYLQNVIQPSVPTPPTPTPTLQQVFNTEPGGSKLTKSDTIAMATNSLSFLNGNVGIGASSTVLFDVVSSGSDNLIYVDQINHNTSIESANGTAYSSIALLSDGAFSNVLFDITSSDGVNSVDINGNPIAQTITLTAANGLIYTTPPSGAATDSIITWDSGSETLNERSLTSIYPTLQQVFNTEVGGSALPKSDTILISSDKYLLISGSNSVNELVEINNTGSADALFINANSGYGVDASSNSGSGGSFTSSSGIGVYATTTTGAEALQAYNAGGGLSGYFIIQTSSTNSIADIVNIEESTSGTAANGIGGRIKFTTQSVTGGGRFSNSLSSKWSDATDSTRTSQLSITGVNTASNQDIIYFEGNGRTRFNGRSEYQQGGSVASANNLALGLDGNTFEITGTTQINLISNLNWQNGSIIRLVFTSNPTVKNGQATSTTNITLQLAGASDFSATSADVLTLMLCSEGGVQAWREVSRSVN